MKRILLIALLTACGTEDKETPKVEPHKSTEPTVTLDQPTTPKAIEPVAAKAEPMSPARTYGKVRKGMTKAEAIEALGEPEDVTSYTTFVSWYYPESFCSLYSCSLQFDSKTGLLTEVEGMKSQFVDLASF